MVINSSLILKLYGLFTILECQHALGMENGAISDWQISASSQYDSLHAPRLGRLHLKASAGYTGGWAARHNDVNQWLMIDMRHQNTIVTAVATQGRNANNQWVKKYKIQYRVWRGGSYQYYTEQGQSVTKVHYYIPTKSFN